MADILSIFDPENIKRFKKDILLVMNVAYSIDMEYGEANEKFTRDFSKFKELVKVWNNKYPKVHIIVSEDGIQCDLKIFIKEQEIGALLLNCAKINGLVSINNIRCSNLSKANVGYFLNKVSESLELLYIEANIQNTLNFDMPAKKIELVYERKDIIDIKAPEFRITAFYALSNFQPKIDLDKYKTEFSFDTIEKEIEGKGISYQSRVPLY